VNIPGEQADERPQEAVRQLFLLGELGGSGAVFSCPAFVRTMRVPVERAAEASDNRRQCLPFLVKGFDAARREAFCA